MEKKRLLDQLQRAQKMEALGMLAGALVISGVLVFALTRSSSDDAAGTDADPIDDAFAAARPALAVGERST